MLAKFLKWLEKVNAAKAKKLEIIIALKNIPTYRTFTVLNVADCINNFCPSLKKDFGNFILNEEDVPIWEYGGNAGFLISNGFIDKKEYLYLLETKIKQSNILVPLYHLWINKLINYNDIKDILLRTMKKAENKKECKNAIEGLIHAATINKTITTLEMDNYLRDLNLSRFVEGKEENAYRIC